jgi:predicted SnoaL-like aldol condensation-catalyzing enzyme
MAAKDVEIDRIVEGKIAETWDFPDYFSLLKQMGAIRG